MSDGNHYKYRGRGVQSDDQHDTTIIAIDEIPQTENNKVELGRDRIETAKLKLHLIVL